MIKLFLLFLVGAIYLSANDQIEVYSCYGNQAHIVVEGRLLVKRDLSLATKEDGWLQNFWRKSKELINNEIKNTPLFLTVENMRYATKSDYEGYFIFDINLTNRLSSGYHPLKIDLGVQKLQDICNLLVISPKNKTGIISDFDDTVIISEVSSKVSFLEHMLFENYKQRQVVPHMAKLFHQLLSQNPNPELSALFFITGSPRQLFPSIQKFLNYHHFPRRILITKKVHGNDSDPLFDQFAYKRKRIEELIGLYPDIKWALFGDNSEKDREVYLYIRQKYPNSVFAIWIRDVYSGKVDSL